MQFTLESLEVIDAIDRKGSFAAAAAELGKVPSALTYAVRKLEDDLDVLLFDRRGHRATLTAAGRVLLDDGRHLLQAADDLSMRVRKIASGWEAELRIAVDTLLHFDPLLRLACDFYAANPVTRLRFARETLGGNSEALIDARADLAIGISYAVDHQQWRGIETAPLGEVRFVFCVAPDHPLATAAEPLAPEVIARHRIVAVGDSSRRLPARSVGVAAGQDLLVVPSIPDKVAAQVAGLGCGWLPAGLAAPHLAQGSLVARATVEERKPGTLSIAWRGGSRGKAMGWWLDKLAEPRVREALLP